MSDLDPERVRLALSGRLAFLSRASAALSSSLDPDETLRELARLVVPAIADWCLVEMAEPDGGLRNVAIAHPDPEKVSGLEAARRPAPSEEAVGRVIRSGEPILVPEVRSDDLAAVAMDDEHLRPLNRIGLASVMIVPIGSHGATIGAISLFAAESGRRFDQDDLAFALEIARRASIAVENAQLHDAERAARHDAERVIDRLARLQAVTSSLSSAATERDVAEVIVREGLTALRGQAGGVWLAEPDGALRVIAAAGYPPEVEDEMRATPHRPGPVAEASARRDVVVVASAQEFDERWPHLRELRARVGDESVAAAPMVIDDRVLGVVYVAFRQPHVFDAEEHGFLVTLARQCAQAIDRARLYEAERNRLQLERDARAEADRARRRLQQLQAITEAGLAQLPLDDSLASMLQRLRDAIACDAAAVLLIDETGHGLDVRAVVGFGGRGAPVRSIAIGRDVLGRVASTGDAAVVDDLGDEAVPPFAAGEIGSVAVTPLRASGEVAGVLHAGSRLPRRFITEDLELIDLAAERIALAIERARVFEREHRIAETLQRSLLPEVLPELPGLELAARYLPGGADAQVGGDWYEVVPLADGHLAAAVGDVVGRGIRAAAAMGQFRNAMRALALEGLSHARLLERLSELSLGLGREFATAITLRLDPTSGVITYSSAGHPPPLVVEPDGTARLLEGGRSTPLGVEPGIAYPEAAARLRPGSTLVLYTDGLIERRGQALDAGLRALLRAAEDAPDGAEGLLDALRERLASDEQRDDDVAMLALRYVHAPRRLELRLPSTPESVARFREGVRGWLTSEGIMAADVEDVILAVSEACSNAVEHAGTLGGDVAVTIELRDEDIRLSVRDAGRWRPPHLRFERGRGFRILRAVMQEVAVTRRGDGTEVRMRRELRDTALRTVPTA